VIEHRQNSTQGDTEIQGTQYKIQNCKILQRKMSSGDSITFKQQGIYANCDISTVNYTSSLMYKRM